MISLVMILINDTALPKDEKWNAHLYAYCNFFPMILEGYPPCISKKKMKKNFVNVVHRLIPHSLRSHYSSNTQRNFLVYLEGTFMSMNIPPLFKGYEAYSLRGHRSYTNLTPP